MAVVTTGQSQGTRRNNKEEYMAELRGSTINITFEESVRTAQ